MGSTFYVEVFDARNGQSRGKLPCLDWKVQWKARDVGGMDVTVPMFPPASIGGVAVTYPTSSMLAPGVCGMALVEEDSAGVKTVRWGGFLLDSVKVELAAQTLSFHLTDPWGLLQRRLVRNDVSYLNIEQVTLMNTVLAAGFGVQDVAPVGPAFSVGSTPAPTGILRTAMIYTSDRKKWGDVVKDLVNLPQSTEPIFSWTRSPSGVFSCSWSQRYPATDWSTNVVFDLGVMGASSLSIDINCAAMASRVTVDGEGYGVARLSRSYTTGLAGTFLATDRVVSQADLRTQYQIDAAAQAFRDASDTPTWLPSFAFPLEAGPRMFSTWECGSTVRVFADLGPLVQVLDDRYKITEVSMGWDNGALTVAPMLASAATFEVS